MTHEENQAVLARYAAYIGGKRMNAAKKQRLLRKLNDWQAVLRGQATIAKNRR